MQEEEDFRFVLLKAPFIHPPHTFPSLSCLPQPPLPAILPPLTPRRTTTLATVRNFLHKMSVFDKLILVLSGQDYPIAGRLA